MTHGTKQSQDVYVRNSNFTAKFTDVTLPLVSMTDVEVTIKRYLLTDSVFIGEVSVQHCNLSVCM